MATYYIATTGNDTTGNGTLATPWLTLAKGLTGSTTGDTLTFAAGTYTVAGNSVCTNRTIQGATGGSPISTTGWTVFSAGGSTGGFTQVGGTTNYYNIWFTNVVRAFNGSTGFIGTTGVATTTVSGCRFSNMTVVSHSNYAGLIGSNDFNTQIVYLTVSSCVFDDVQCHMSANANYNLIGGRGKSVGSYVRFYNNTMSFRTEALRPANGLFGGYYGDSCDYSIKNCIFKNSCSSISIICATPGTFTNGFNVTNCCYNGTFGTSGITATNCITSDPLLIDESNADFRLRPTSPCLSTGTIL